MLHKSKIKRKTLEEQVYESQERCYNGALEKPTVYETINKLIQRFSYDGRIFRELDPITIEIAMDNKKEVVKLLENGIDVNEINKLGITPLITAIYFNNLEIANLLVERGANVNYRFYNGFTPLILSCNNHNDEIVEMLLKNGVNVNEVDSYGYNSLHHVVNCGNPSDLLSNFYLFDELKFAFSGKSKKTNSSIISRLRCIELLIDNGIDASFCNEKNGINALSIVLEGDGRDCTKMIKKLIQKGAEKKAIEISPFKIYDYQDSFDFINDIKDFDLSCWPLALIRFLYFIIYKKRIKKFNIEVYYKDKKDCYKRPKFVKKM